MSAFPASSLKPGDLLFVNGQRHRVTDVRELPDGGLRVESTRATLYLKPEREVDLHSHYDG